MRKVLLIAQPRCEKSKIIGFFLISKYMIKKYGFAEAVLRTAKRKKK
jgi:hypothetical protein